jgi:O-antigen ligase
MSGSRKDGTEFGMRDWQPEMEAEGRGAGGYRWLPWLLLVLWLVAAGPREGVLGLGLVLAGGWMLASPAVAALPRWVWILALVWLGCAVLNLLPADFGRVAEWRGVLGAAGLPTGDRITPQLPLALEGLAGQFLSGLVLLRILSLPDPGSRRTAFAIGALAVVLVYLVLAMIAWESKGGADAGKLFGFFTNRNHNATLLAMGAAVATGLLLQAGRRRSLGLIGFAIGAVTSLTLALVFVNISRAGIFLLLLGVAGIGVLSGRAYLRGHGAKILGLLVLAAAVVLLVPDSRVKERLARKLWNPAGETEAGAVVKLDHRLEIFNDTLGMIRSQPLTGWGTGQFRVVFPQYRSLAANVNGGLHLHPESSWLWMAAESGVPAAATVLILGLAVVGCGVRAARKGPDRALRCGLVVAASLPLVHGIVDVPLHRESLLWFSGYLLALSGPFHARGQGGTGRWTWRAAGMVVLAGGAVLLHGAVTGRPVTPAGQVEARLKEARRLYALDQAAVAGGVEPPLPGPVDPLELALSELEAALRIAPLDPRLHGLHGMLALHFDDKDSQVEADFARQRLLSPRWVRLPLVQAEGWKRIRPEESVRLWGVALGWARAQREVAGSDPAIVRTAFAGAIRAALGSEDLEADCVALAAGDRELLEEAVLRLPRPALARLEPALRGMMLELEDHGELIALLEGRAGGR